MMNVKVDKETCIGCELCPSICPDVFQMGEDGLAFALFKSVPDDFRECVREAAESCPVNAIRVS
jgi:ferredoxin